MMSWTGLLLLASSSHACDHCRGVVVLLLTSEVVVVVVVVAVQVPIQRQTFSSLLSLVEVVAVVIVQSHGEEHVSHKNGGRTSLPEISKILSQA